MVQTGSYTGGSPTAPDFSDGWWSYVSKDLRDLYGPKPKGAWSRVYCGDGSKQKCRKMLQRTLAAALKVTPQQLYGGGDGACAANPQPSCFDQNRPAVTGGIRAALPVPEPADLPAGGDADPAAAAVREGRRPSRPSASRATTASSSPSSSLPERAWTPGVARAAPLLSFPVGLVGRLVRPAVRFMGRAGIL